MTAAAAVSLQTSPFRWVRLALLADGGVTLLNGLGYVALGQTLSSWLGPSPAVLRELGVFLGLYAVGVLALARQAAPALGLVRLVIAVNVAWVLGSVVAMELPLVELTGLGLGWGVLQAVVVAGFAALQTLGLRRARGA